MMVWYFTGDRRPQLDILTTTTRITPSPIPETFRTPPCCLTPMMMVMSLRICGHFGRGVRGLSTTPRLRTFCWGPGPCWRRSSWGFYYRRLRHRRGPQPTGSPSGPCRFLNPGLFRGSLSPLPSPPQTRPGPPADPMLRPSSRSNPVPQRIEPALVEGLLQLSQRWMWHGRGYGNWCWTISFRRMLPWSATWGPWCRSPP
ncbi:uncharacterized protein LOC124371723 [Homalodisca vitripennis]|uniref:uncharacterized protein LOC124371723 n=1 Tax=Homalodisca vitripennis TaxID=197043 RepID=UPI001EEA2C38|nr:uncharacterized protein LOC124371723 [Homalodisca vitripennis]